MLNLSLLQNLLIIAIACGTITILFIQKTKHFFPCSNCVIVYSLIVNLIFSYFFCQIFCSDVSIVESIWVGLFSFLEADTIYKTLEGKLAPYREIISKKNGDNIVGVINYE